MEKGMLGMMALECCESLGLVTSRRNRDMLESYLETALTTGLQTTLVGNHEENMKIYNQREEIRNLSRACMRKTIHIKSLRTRLEISMKELIKTTKELGSAEGALARRKKLEKSRKVPKIPKTAANGSEKLKVA